MDSNDVGQDPYRAPRAETVEREGAEPAGAQPREWDLIEAFTFGWNAIKAYPMAILAAFVATLIGSVFGMLAGGVQSGLNATQDPQLMTIGWIVYGLGMLGNIPLAVWMAVGMARFALAMARGARPELGSIFAGRGFGAAFGAQLVMILGAIATLVVLVGPGAALLILAEGDSVLGWVLLAFGALAYTAVVVYFGVRWFLVNLFAADGLGGAFDVLRASWRTTDGRFWSFVLFALLAIGVSIAATVLGLLACCVGMLVTVPAGQMMTNLAAAYVFLCLRGETPRLTNSPAS